jgi:ribosomal protein L21E
VNSTQQKKPRPTMLRRIPTTSMVAVPVDNRFRDCAFHHHHHGATGMIAENNP